VITHGGRYGSTLPGLVQGRHEPADEGAGEHAHDDIRGEVLVGHDSQRARRRGQRQLRAPDPPSVLESMVVGHAAHRNGGREGGAGVPGVEGQARVLPARGLALLVGTEAVARPRAVSDVLDGHADGERERSRFHHDREVPFPLVRHVARRQHSDGRENRGRQRRGADGVEPLAASGASMPHGQTPHLRVEAVELTGRPARDGGGRRAIEQVRTREQGQGGAR
jgi:hypothetical protein